MISCYCVKMKEQSRILGIDFGSKRIGVALSDVDRQFAMPLQVVEQNRDALQTITDIARKSGATEIVIGESRNYKGDPNEIYEASMRFKKALEDSGFKVSTEPEFMTSMQAERFQGKNELTDASAAALILQSYLDRHFI